MNQMETIVAGTYNLRLVALSVAIAIVASYTAIDCSSQIAQHRQQSGDRSQNSGFWQGLLPRGISWGWLTGAAVAMGLGIWSMHFVGMLAWQVSLPIAYPVPTVLLSAIVAIAGSGGALLLVSHPQSNWIAIATGGTIMGLTIAAIHYIDAISMQLPATLHYNRALVATSIAIGAATCGLGWAKRWQNSANRSQKYSHLWHWGSASLMGTAISGMHYIGMAAFSLTPNRETFTPSDRQSADVCALGIMIAAIALMSLWSLLLQSKHRRTLSDRALLAEARIEKLLQHMDVGVVLMGPKGEVLLSNQAALELLGIPESDLLGKELFNTKLQILQEDCTPFPPALSPVSRAIATGTPSKVVIGIGVTPLTQAADTPEPVRCSTCSIPCHKWLLVYANPQMTPEGRLEQVVCTFSDITDEKRAEAILRQREKRLRRQSAVLAELSKSPSITEGDLQASLRQITEAAAHTLEVERASIWLYNQDRSAIRCIDLYQRSTGVHSSGTRLTNVDCPNYFQALGQERIIVADRALTHPDTRDFRESYLKPLGITSILDAPIRIGGQMVGIVCHEQVGLARRWSVEDENFAASVGDCVALGLEASDRARAKAALQNTLNKLQAVLDTVPGCVSWIGSDLRYLGVNRYLASLFGRSPHEFVGQEIGFLQTNTEFKEFLRAFFASPVLKKSQELRLEIAGVEQQYLIAAEKYNNGEAAVSVGIDITELKRTEEALIRERAFLRSLIDSIPDLIFYKNKQSVYQRCNKAFAEFTGRDPNEILGKSDRDLFPPEEAEICQQIDREMLAKARIERREEQMQTAEGTPIFLETIQTPFFGPDGDILGIIGVSRDITERKQVEMALKKANDELELRVAERTSFLQQTNELLQVEIAQRGRVQKALKASETQLRQCLSAARMGIWDWDIESDTLTWSAELEGLFELPPGSFDGRYETYLKLLDPEDRPRVESTMAAILNSHTTRFEIEQRLSRSEGRIRWFSVQGEVLRDRSGQAIRTIGTMMDISDRKRAEIALQQAAVVAEAANQAKSAFLANMSHELRTPLNAIIGYSEILQEEALDFGYKECISDLEKIHKAGNHLLSLINDILDISKIEAGKMDLYLEPFNIIALVNDVVATVQPMMEKNGNQLTVSCDRCLDTMFADFTKVRQILLNLLSNAAKFTHKGKIALTVNAHLKHDTIQGSPLDNIAHSWIAFRVTDTGIGITPEQSQQLFQPFTQGDTSTTRKYGGTGLGLAISSRFCQMMGGEIELESELGKGSTFSVYLPTEVAHPH